MAWQTPTSRTTGTLITASIWNTDLVDDLIYLYDFARNILSGVPFIFAGSALVPTTTTSYPSGATYDKLAPNTGVFNVDSAVLVGTYKLEAILAVEGSATVSLALVNISDGSPDAAMVTITSTSATGQRVQSSAITFAGAGAAKDYGVKIKTSDATKRAWAWNIRLVRTA